MLPGDAPAFTVNTVNTAALSVNLLNPTHTPARSNKLYTAGGKKTFQRGDNFTVLSMGFVLPESFVLAKAPANTVQNNLSITLGVNKILSVETIYYLPNFGDVGIQLPLENYETPLGVFVDVMSIGASSYPFRTEGFQITVVVRGLNEALTIYPQVSMVGVPAVLNATVQHITVFAKILHNLPLV